ncbi:unnamed protein product [Closterium sp. Yama58-4]|nr:unnamed protein product [Closterium sp. Yama58-4]
MHFSLSVAAVRHHIHPPFLPSLPPAHPSHTTQPQQTPRKGCFEVRLADGSSTFISLLSMPRPFGKLKALDIDAEAEKIVKQLQEAVKEASDPDAKDEQEKE